MAIESIVIPAATGAIGIALGLGAALTLSHRQRELPKAEKGRDPWEHLKALTEERAQASAMKKALHRAYAAGSVTEHAFISKDSHYTKIVDRLDSEIDHVVAKLGAQFLPEELQKGRGKLGELSDMAVLSKHLDELKRDKKRLEEESGRLYLQMAELEDDKRLHLSEWNKIKAKYAEDMKRLTDMGTYITELERHRGVLEAKVAGLAPRDRKISMLERENRILRESLGGARKKLRESEKSIGVLATVIDRHAAQIDEAKKADELRALVEPKNQAVKELVREHRTPKAAYEYVRDHILEVHPKVSASYWLGVDDILRVGAADPDDKAILLCSMLRATGQDATVAMLEMRNGYRRAVVIWGDHVLDPWEARGFDDFTGLSREEALGKYRFDGFPIKRVLYEFNDLVYSPKS